MKENPVILSAGFSWKLISMTLLIMVTFSDFGGAQDYLNPYECMDTGNYTINSKYSVNLNDTLSAISANTSQYGFYTASAGRDEDRAHAIALCRTDRSIDDCQSCVRNAATELVQLCPNQKQAIRWYEFCMLHYSNKPIVGARTDRGVYVLMNSANVSDPVQFQQDRLDLMDDLITQAANGSSLLKVGAGTRNTSDTNTLYALLLCVPTLSTEECDSCLSQAIQQFPPSAQGARILGSSCNVRYELYPFYDHGRLQELHVLPSPPPPLPQTPNSSPGMARNNTRKKKDNNTTKIVLIIVVPVVACLIFAACAVFLMKRSRIKKGLPEIPEKPQEISTVESLQYDFRQISAATNDFADANMLGQGGFGAVYRGKLSNGQEIAVKRLSREFGQGDKEFKNEVLLVARLQHKNLVRLFGFSLQGIERLLIYEYVLNASLDRFIFDPIKSSVLDWGRRHKIIGGIARGLLYLHEDSRLRIIHRDLKASNILLDGDMNPKIADFGMARLFGQDETQGNTSKIAGTYGYMAPEYALYGQFSMKSDVFSFGVLVLEIISGQRNTTRGEETEGDVLSFVWKNWCENTTDNVIDPVLKAGGGSISDMFKCIHIALLCVQENPADRPTMNTVVVMLSSSTVTLPVPSQPAFMVSIQFGPGMSNSGEESKVEAQRLEGLSQNEMSVSGFYPR